MYHRDVRAMLTVIALACGGFGCDALFGLDRVTASGSNSDAGSGSDLDGGRRDSSPHPDAACAAQGSVSTVMLGARVGGTGATADTFLVDTPANINKNYGADDTLALCNVCSASGEPWNGNHAVSLLWFDVSPICPGSTIQDVRLLLDTTGDNLGSGVVSVYSLVQSWTEGSGPGTGTTGAASWTQRVALTNWNVPGGSHGVTALATFSPTDTNMTYAIAIPTAVVQSWLDTPPANFGLELVITTGNSDVQFYSREGGTATQRPGLQVTSAAN